jgi:hypothetical protein
MLFRETVAVYCENLTEHILWAECRILLYVVVGGISRNSSVGIATDYGLDDREVGVRVQVG